MSRNPFDVLFGSSVVAQLQHKPDALKRIARSVKPLLMGEALSSQRSQNGGEQVAVEINQAFEQISTASGDEVKELAVAFLASQRGREEDLKRNARDLRGSTQGLQKLLESKNLEVQNLIRTVTDVRRLAYQLLVSYLGMPIPDFPDAVPIGLIHRYRIIVQTSDDYYHGYDFWEGGRRARKVGAKNYEIIRDPSNLNVTMVASKNKKAKSRYMLLGCTSEHVKRGFSSGKYSGGPISTMVKDMLNNGILHPFVAKGLFPFFVLVSDNFNLVESDGHRVVDVVPMPPEDDLSPEL